MTFTLCVDIYGDEDLSFPYYLATLIVGLAPSSYNSVLPKTITLSVGVSHGLTLSHLTQQRRCAAAAPPLWHRREKKRFFTCGIWEVLVLWQLLIFISSFLLMEFYGVA